MYNKCTRAVCIYLLMDIDLYINPQLHVFDSSYSRNKNVLKYCCKSLLSCFLDFLKAGYMYSVHVNILF